MPHKINITAARNRFLTLPAILAPGEAIEVVRHRKTVLKIIRPPVGVGQNPFDILDEALSQLSHPGTKMSAPRNLASRYKYYLYGKKK